MLVPRLTRAMGNSQLLATGMSITLVGLLWLAWVANHGIGQGLSLGLSLLILALTWVVRASPSPKQGH